MKAKKIAIFGLMGALAAVIGFFESALLPALPFLPPGAKPGLSNIVTTFAVAAYSLVGGLYVTLCKAAFVFLTRGVTAGLMMTWFGGGRYDYSVKPGTGFTVTFRDGKPVSYERVP